MFKKKTKKNRNKIKHKFKVQRARFLKNLVYVYLKTKDDEKPRSEENSRKMQITSTFFTLLLLALSINYTDADSSSTTTTTTTTTKRPAVVRITKPQPRTTTIAAVLESSTANNALTALFMPSTTTKSKLPDDDDIDGVENDVPDICVHGLQSAIVGQTDGALSVLKPYKFVQHIEGDVMLSIFTTDPASALFVVNRVNEAKLLEADFELGVRVIQLAESLELAESLLLQEVQYLQRCTLHALGIFIDHDMYKRLASVIEELEYNIWPIPPVREQLFPRVAHLLQQMPWTEQIASVEIITETLDIYNDFMAAVRHEHMCLMHFKSNDNIYIVFGNRLASQLKQNGTIFAVPLERSNRDYIADLPDRAYILLEHELELRDAALDLDASTTTHTKLHATLVGKSVLPSRILALGSPMLELMRWLRVSLAKHCKRLNGLYLLKSCFNFLSFIEDWRAPEYQQRHDSAELIAILRMRKLAPLMNYQMFQKRLELLDGVDGELPLELREIATQNFITNVTTFYHYNRDNHTSIELQPKFGQIYNCQYSADEHNRRHPFLYEGESVMFWRIKPDVWVAAGFTAAVLGLLASLAILVFIVARISLRDVFEGNPVTSVLLLVALVLVFSSFVPYAIEYVGEQPNSHVTYEDAETLNTLCAVRVFVLTLTYCFVFSLLLCRAVMLASIGSEGGFLSHVNGYIQAVICVFSVFVQLGMSIQLLVVMHIAAESVSCELMYYGHWLWALIGYDFVLLLSLVALVPFVYRSQRNYREGILIVIGGALSFVVWCTWIVFAQLGDEWRDAAIPLGMQATGWAILVGILIPRTFLIVRGIERSDIARALPSLTSLAFVQNNQFSSEQSVYECVNPAMRNCSQENMHQQTPSEIPTLPLRGGGPRRQQFFANLRQANASINPPRQPPRPYQSPTRSSVSSLPPSPDNSKITRF